MKTISAGVLALAGTLAVTCGQVSLLSFLTVAHRVIAMASGGMDDLPHRGAVITVLAVAGLTHRQSYGDILLSHC
jgi:H+/gluconate symporter-like permease